MTRTERRGYDLQASEWTFQRTKRDDKSCRDKWCCGNRYQKLEARRSRQAAKKQIRREQ